jgi:cation transport ATPase
LKTLVLTGDRRVNAAAMARHLDVDVLAEQLPEDKAAAVRRLGRRVAMVGDGINDAPALAAAEVGVALGCGADLSRDAAGVCLLADRLDRLPWAVALARQTLRVVRQNLFWAFVYNIGGIALAATGRLNPIWAAAAMGVSSVMVIGNSLRLGNGELGTRSRAPEESPEARLAAPVSQLPVSGSLLPAPRSPLLAGSRP